MREIEIKKGDAGQRLDKYLAKLLKEAPKSFLYKMLRKKNIVLNQKKATGSEKLVPGDTVCLFLSDDTFEKFAGNIHTEEIEQISDKELTILYEDEDILMVDKPAGMLSQKAVQNDISANEYILHYLLKHGTITKESLRTFQPSVCNRLDRNTSGILIFGKTLQGSQKMSQALRERGIQKYYLCLVHGQLTQAGRIEGYLKKDTQSNQVVIKKVPESGAKPIITEYRPLKQVGDCTLLEVHLITGKSHQIRAHLAAIGHPIIGDPKYGNHKRNQEFFKNANISHQLLHAYRLRLDDGTDITAEMPEAFKCAIHYLENNTTER